MEKVTTQTIKRMKQDGKKITMLTAYDYSTAALLDQVGIDILLVGDSLGMVVLGYETTLPVTMEEMLHHTRAVARASKRAMVVGDMPFMSYQVSTEQALENAGRFLKEADAHAVKLEGGVEIVDTVKRLVDSGIPVMGHLGLTPQSIHQLGGYGVQGKEDEAAKKMIDDAIALEEAGIFSLVLECVPTALAKGITEQISVPTIGIGAGVYCDGQVLVTHDLLGIFEKFVPKFVKRYVELNKPIKEAVNRFIEEVKQGKFPGPEHSFGS